MSKSRSTFWGLLALVLALLVLGMPVSARRVTGPAGQPRGPLDNADPNAVRSLIQHDVGNVRMTLSNWGEMGNPDAVPGFKGFEYPINSGSDFLFSGGVWVGAQMNGQRLVTTATDGDNGTNEFYPVHIGTYPADRASVDGDWYVTSKSFSTFNGRSYVWGSKGVDEDGDWTAADDRNGDGKPSANWDLGSGFIGYDDDGDGLVDEDSVVFVGNVPTDFDADGDGNFSDTGPSGDHNQDGNCNYDPEPKIDEDPAGDMSHDYVDNDNDGLVDMADPDFDGDLRPGLLDDDGDGRDDEDGVARGVQEYYTVYQDDIEAQFVGSPDSDGHVPLKIMVLQRSYAFPEAYASEFILVDYRIRSFNPLPLENVYVAWFADPDIGAAGEGGDAASTDDGNYYDPGRLMMIQYDDPNDNDGPGPGIFAVRVVKTPAPLDLLRISFTNFNRLTGGDPETNADKYNMISSGQISPPTASLNDWRFLIGFGPDATDGFRLDPGKELPITIALLAGADTVRGSVNADWAMRMYLNDFQGPSAPDVPEFEVNVRSEPDGKRYFTEIRWYPNAEGSLDPITKRYDFEGYIIEKSTDQINWLTIKAYDVVDRVDTIHVWTPSNPDSFYVDPTLREFEWQNFNLGMPADTHWVNDSTWQYQYADSALIPGHSYYYCVRAYDKGVLGAGILYSGRTGNTQQALMARTDATGAPTGLGQIYVFPNPYKGSHAGEEGGQLNASKGLIEYPRKLCFMGLPANREAGKCRIRIYSLAGDHVATIDHVNGTEYEQWDLITMNKQEIVSGIYYYVVEYHQPGGGTEHFIDKFVVIK